MTTREPSEGDAEVWRLYSDTASQLSDVARKLVAADHRHQHGDHLRDALRVAVLAERLVAVAVVVERGRGATWEAIGEVDGGLTGQSAQEKWADTSAWLGHLVDGPGAGPEGSNNRQTPGLSSMFNQVSGQVFGTVVQVAGGVGGDVHIGSARDQLGTLSDESAMAVLRFLVSFENCLEDLGDLRTQLDFLPQGMGPVLDAVAYSQVDAFLTRSGLGDTPSPGGTADVPEALAFLLKVAFVRGYFMLHFHRLDRIPRPVRPVAPMTIMDLIVAEGDPAHPERSLADAIEVILRRVVSRSTEPEVVTKSLRMLGDPLARIVQPHLDLWCGIVGSAHAYGILAAKAEAKMGVSPASEQ